MNKKPASSNAAHRHPLITITVLEVDDNSCTYKNFWEKGIRTFTFNATTGFDRNVLAGLQVGKSYAVQQTVIQNRTHWTSAVPYYKSDGKPKDNFIQAFQSRKQAVVKVNPDLLDALSETVEF